MATRSIIAKRIKYRGKLAYKAIYCHFDGYPRGVGAKLRKYYNNPSKIDKLLALGDISVLGKEIGRKHDFDKGHPGWTLAYSRDRGEDWYGRKPKILGTMEELKSYAKSVGVDYLYVYENGKWHTIRVSGY